MAQQCLVARVCQLQRGSSARPKSYRRLLLAFSIAAITPGLLVGVALSVAPAVGNPIWLLGAIYILPPVGAFFGLFTTVPTILIAGMPAYLLYGRLGWSDWPTHLLGGALIGWLVNLVLYGKRAIRELEQSANALGLIGAIPVAWQLSFALFGAAAASMFWFVLYTRRGEQAFLAKAAVVSLAAIGLALLR